MKHLNTHNLVKVLWKYLNPFRSYNDFCEKSGFMNCAKFAARIFEKIHMNLSIYMYYKLEYLNQRFSKIIPYPGFSFDINSPKIINRKINIIEIRVNSWFYSSRNSRIFFNFLISRKWKIQELNFKFTLIEIVTC